MTPNSSSYGGGQSYGATPPSINQPATQNRPGQWDGVSSGRATAPSVQPFSYDKLNETALAGRRGGFAGGAGSNRSNWQQQSHQHPSQPFSYDRVNSQRVFHILPVPLP